MLPTLVGYCAIFDSPSEDMGFIETIRRGAFDTALKGSDARALVNHDPSLVLGREKSGTLRLSVDSIGLRAEIDPPDTQMGHDVVTLVRRGDWDAMSYAFTVADGGEEWRVVGEQLRRTLTKIARVYDASVVSTPAFLGTSIGIAGEPASGKRSSGIPLEILMARQRLSEQMDN